MVIERLTVAPPPGERERLVKTLAYLRNLTLVLPGCLACHLFKEIADTDEKTLSFEVHWASQNDLIRHLQSETYKQFLLLMELSVAPPVLQFYLVEQIQGLELVKIARGFST